MIESAYNILKVASVIAIVAVFAIAINAFLFYIVPIVVPAVVQECLGLLSVFLPFDAYVFFTSVNISLAVIGGFMCADKIFDLNSRSIKSA